MNSLGTNKLVLLMFRFQFALIGAIAWTLWNPATAAGASAQKHVLLFFDARSDMLGNVVVDRAIRAVLNKEFSVDIDIRSDYFDVTPLKKSDYPVLVSWLRRKYAGTKFDVVVAVGASALAFIREYEGDLFADAKLVFWGNRRGLDNWGSGPPVTGVVSPTMDNHVAGIFEFIRTLQPDLEQLIVISGTSEVDRMWETAARQKLRPFEGRIAITYLAGLPLEDVQARLLDLPKKSAILFLTMNEDGAGRRLIKADILNKLIQQAGAPIYSTSAIHLENGIIGGALVHQEQMAIETAGLVTRLLRGEKVRDMPVRESRLVPTVNWPVLNRWNIPVERLPRDTTIIHQDQSIWTQYKWQIIGFFSVCIFEGLLIVALVVHRANRRRAEKAMWESRRLLQSTIDALDARVALLDETGTIIAANEAWRSSGNLNEHAGTSQGRNYLKVCESSASEEAHLESKGIRAVMSGEQKDFRYVYPSAHDGETSWYQVRVNRFRSDGMLRLVVAHEDVTEIRKAHDAQQHLTGLLLRAQDDVRRRIARDLHDVTAQNLAAIRADLTQIQRTSQASTPAISETLNESLTLCDRVIKELRTLSYLLHPPLLDEAGLIPALHWFVRGFMQRSGIQVELLVIEDIGRLGTDIETALFRVVQESLTNVHRHSGSRSAVIWVTKEEQIVRVQITDEGHGFLTSNIEDNDAALSAGVGIMGMRQRIKQLGGELEIESNAQGTTINAKIAISEEQYATYSSSR